MRKSFKHIARSASLCIDDDKAIDIPAPLSQLSVLVHEERGELARSPSESNKEDITSLIEQGIIWAGVPSEDSPPPLWARPPLSSETIPFGAEAIDSHLPGGGLPCGAVHELYYDDPTGVTNLPSSLPALLAGNIVKRYHASPASAWHRKNTNAFPYFLIWIGKRAWPSPYCLDQQTLRSCLFIDPPSQKLALWSLESALRSAAVKLVVIDCPNVSLTLTRRLTLAARAHGTTAILLKNNANKATPSAAHSKWVIAPRPSPPLYPFPSWRLDLAKIKGASPTVRSWVVSLESRYDEGQKVSLCVLPSLVDRCNGEEAQTIRYGT